MAMVQYKMVRAWMGACILAGALSAVAEEAGKPAASPSAKGVTAASVKTQAAAPAKAKPAKAKPAVAGSGRMKVEVPKSAASAPDARGASKAWQKSHAKGLTEDQKKAFRDRKEGMETLISVIKAKRKALHEAKPEDRAALARELHSLILEKDEGATAAARVDASAPKDAKPVKAAGADARAEAAARAEALAQRREEYRKLQAERKKLWKTKGDDGD